MADDKPKPDQPQWVPMTLERWVDLVNKGFGPPLHHTSIVEDRKPKRDD